MYTILCNTKYLLQLIYIIAIFILWFGNITVQIKRREKYALRK